MKGRRKKYTIKRSIEVEEEETAREERERRREGVGNVKRKMGSK